MTHRIRTITRVLVVAFLLASLCACSSRAREQAIPGVIFEEINKESDGSGYEMTGESERSEELEVNKEDDDTGSQDDHGESRDAARLDQQAYSETSDDESVKAGEMSKNETDDGASADTETDDANAAKILNEDAEIPDVVTVKSETGDRQPAPEEPREKPQEEPREKPQEVPQEKPQETPQVSPQETPHETPTPSGNGRILFIGDSRTIDMFADSDDTISGAVIDGITVYAAHGRGYDYLTGVINDYGIDSFDTLITWMGANDAGDFSRYAGYYESILAAGKRLVLCTVGPTNDNTLAEWDHPDYENEKMTNYNSSLVSWAQQHGVNVIDLYSFIASNVQIDDADGIHYLPRPTGSIWAYILNHGFR